MRLTVRNEDGSVSPTTTDGRAILEKLAECEEKEERRKTGWKKHFEETVRALADNDISVRAAAAASYWHPNTLYYRSEQIKQHTGLDPLRFRDLVKLLALADSGEYKNIN